MFLNNSQNWQKNNCARVSFLIKLQAGRLPLECYLSISFIITSTGKHWSYNHSSLYRYHLNHMKSHEINVLSFPSFSIFLWNSLKIRCSYPPWRFMSSKSKISLNVRKFSFNFCIKLVCKSLFFIFLNWYTFTRLIFANEYFCDFAKTNFRVWARDYKILKLRK